MAVNHRVDRQVASKYRQGPTGQVDVLGVLEYDVRGTFLEHRVFPQDHTDEPVDRTLERRIQRRALQTLFVLVVVLMHALGQILLGALAHRLGATVDLAAQRHVGHLIDIRLALVVGVRWVVTEPCAIDLDVAHTLGVFDGVF